MNVYIQDIEYIVQFILNMAFYGTPILYQVEMFSNAGALLKLIALNPMTILINGYRDIFFYHHLPQIKPLFAVGVLSLILVFVGYAIFKRLEKGFAEEL